MAAAYALRGHPRSARAGEVTGNGGGEDDERALLDRTLKADRLYVFDRGYAKFALFNHIVKAQSSYVGRLRDNSAYEFPEERPLTDADRAAGILSDQVVRFPNGKAEAQLDHPIRVVCVKTSPHTSRGKIGGGSTGPGSDGVLRISAKKAKQKKENSPPETPKRVPLAWRPYALSLIFSNGA